jgi:hypothetical protein
MFVLCDAIMVCSGDTFGDGEGFDGDGVGMNTADEDNYPYN